MKKCPDCYSDEIVGSRGKGDCSRCKGTGFGTLVDQISSSIFDYESKCDECGGSKKCQTCGGSGVVDNGW